ncbi:MAG: GTP-binding protein [Spirochaetales bacterium]|nr:GTP-binding protein [Spirochaetales bacterium]
MERVQKRTGIIIITGFLGSGKTTLLNRLLGGFRDNKTGLIINDFGSLPVDYEIIKNSSASTSANMAPLIKNVENGSIFCSCRKTVFLEGLDYFAGARPEYLVIETSGISDPGPIHGLLALERFSAVYDLRAIICLVDAATFPQMHNRFLFIERQIKAADIIILNKTDLISENLLHSIERELAVLNPQAAVRPAHYAQVEIDVAGRLFSGTISDADDSPAPDKPLSFFLPEDEIVPGFLLDHREELEKLLIRIKGFFADNGLIYEVNGTASGIRIAAIDYLPGKRGLTIICSPGNRDELLALLEKG